MVMGLISGFFGRGDTITVEFTSRDRFDAGINAAMSEFGFLPVTGSADFLYFRKSMLADWLFGRISVTVGEEAATIVGPAVYVHRLMARFR